MLKIPIYQLYLKIGDKTPCNVPLNDFEWVLVESRDNRMYEYLLRRQNN